ncbi:DNRLRE domain-containing protein [Paenibacillus oryzisoli]|uniref:CBM96 family carbohydrate-binding protein n=1 Tax=Paenibacillus oryzisoli TaxID=1850517 RepID=UPI003D272C58
MVFTYVNKRIISITVIGLLLLSIISALLPYQASAAGTTYYVDSISGNDSNSGTSTGSPWKTLSKVNGTTFAAGDKILFKAGSIWTGQLWPKGSGVSGNPIIIDQYGTGNKPVINGAGTSYPVFVSGAVMLFDQEFWEINNLEVTNNSSTITSARAGILVFNGGTGNKNHIYVKNSYVHDVNSDPNGLKITGGIIVYGENKDVNGNTTVGGKGFNDVLVENNHVANVTKEGIRTATGATDKNNTNIIFRGNFVEEVFGDGMVLSGMISGGVMEYNTIKNHSKTNSANYAGLWTYYSNGTVVQYNEVYGGSGGSNDGEAFDSDNSTNGDIFQYNYSHNNSGGVMLIMPSASNLAFRYNISENDGFRSGQGIFHATSTNSSNKIYNNTIYVGSGITTYVFDQSSPASTLVNFYNNIIKVDGTITAFSKNITWSSGTDFRNNLFYPATIDDVNGPPSHPGLVTANPMLSNPGAGVSNINMTDPNRLPGYKLQASSPAINAGISISGNGGKDFYGNPVYNGSPDIGAYEFQGSSSSSLAFNPIADAYVRDGSYASTNFGTASTLIVKSDASGYARKAYAKFNYSTFSGSSASSAKVRLNVSSANADATRTIKVYGTTDESWTETGITWNNAPAGTTYIGSINVSNAAGQWYELDVTSYINSQMSDKQVSFLFVNEGANSSGGGVDFASREASVNKPELVLTPPPGYNPTADAYVRDGIYSNSNFGTETTLIVKSDASGYARKAYAKFNYSTFSGSSASSAKVRLNVSSANADATRTIKVYGTTDESWTETGITWNNAPAGTTYIGSINVSNAAGQWYELDVTSYINSQMSDKQVSFLFVNEGANSSGGGVDFASREAAGNKPELVLN